MSQDEKSSVPCEACMGTGGLEMNGGLSLSNEYFECEICEGVGEIEVIPMKTSRADNEQEFELRDELEMYDGGDLNDMIEELVIADGGENEWLESYGYEDWSEVNLSKKDAINAIVALKLWNTEVKAE